MSQGIRGIRENKLTKAVLIERLGLPDDKDTQKLKLPELLRLALKDDKVSKVELPASSPTTESAIKCYLHSVVQDKKEQKQIERYVMMASQLFTRGSFIANLIANEAFGDIVKLSKPSDDDELPHIGKFDFLVPQDMRDVMAFIQNREVCKQIFLPERWPTNTVDLDEVIATVVDENTDILNHLLPNWLALMSNSGWDNAISSMYIKYRANVQNHVTVHLVRFVSKYLDMVEMHEGSFRSGLKQCFLAKMRPIVAHNDDFAFVVKLRRFLAPKLKLNEYMYKKVDFTVNSLAMFVFLVKNNITKGTYMPLAKLGRKFCYIDAKIARFLLKDKYNDAKTAMNGREPALIDMFAISPQDYRNRRKLLRQQLRRKYKNKSKKLKQKWERLGRSNMPKDAMVFSIQTDGVGLSICIKRPVEITLDDEAEEDDEENVPSNAVFAGLDFGRAKSFVAAVSTDPIKKPETVMLTRKQYYYEIKHRIRMKWEDERSNRQPVRDALTDLSDNEKINVKSYIRAVSNNSAVLKFEYLYNKERPLWAMRLYRFKKRSQDKAVQKVFDKGKGLPLILGFGDAKFACTGKNEKAMPTVEIMKAFYKARYRYNGKVIFKKIDEHRTTLCCCACGHMTTSPMKPNGRRSGRLRLCSNCNETNGKLRDRDVQAARNILWLTQHVVYGCERPSYLCS